MLPCGFLFYNQASPHCQPIVQRQKSKKKPKFLSWKQGNIILHRYRSGDIQVTVPAGLPGHVYLGKPKDSASMTRREKQVESNMSMKEARTRTALHVTRSQSFGGMSNARLQPTPSTPILGQTLRRNPHVYTRPVQSPRGIGFTFKKSPKIPKVPRPSRTYLMFESVKKGIREFIQVTHDDVASIQGADPNTSTAQQIKAAERYLKRLEFHLAKIDELQDTYLLQQQLREGVRTMARAYVTSPGRQKESLLSVKYGYKECSQAMCAIEAQLESMMGTFRCKLKGMVGFARLCPGDVFEVTIRHGAQKWKTKGRVEKSGNQKWDITDFTFKALVGEVIGIKAIEVRSFKSIVLGQKNCETKELFSANPQMMTVSINTNGSLKLSIIITWNPLEGVDDSATFFETPHRPQGTPRKRPISVLAINGQYSPLAGNHVDLMGHERRHSNPIPVHQCKDDNFILTTSSANHSYMNNDHERLMPMGPGGDKSYLRQRPHSTAVHTMLPPLPSHLLPSMLPGHVHTQVAAGLSDGIGLGKDEPRSMDEALNILSTSLEDFQGHYPELRHLEEVVQSLEYLVRKHSRCSSRASSISVSIESALGAFDFLNTEESVTEDGEHSVDRRIDHQAIDHRTSDRHSPERSRTSSIDQMLASPESTAKTADSGIESLAKRLSEDTQLGSSLGSSPVPPSTGNEQIDHALLQHLIYCERLLEHLGNFGPLKCKEIYSLDKLQKQAYILENLIKLATEGIDIDLHAVMAELTDDKNVKEFWVKCVDDHVMYVTPEKLVATFEQKFGSRIREKYEMNATRVFQHIIDRMLDVPHFELERSTSHVITIQQYTTFFSKENGLGNIDSTAAELLMMDRLCSGNSDMVIKTILSLKNTLPPPLCLKMTGTLCASGNREIQQAAISYLKQLLLEKYTRDKAMVMFVEALEDKLSEIRIGACKALAILQAVESVDQLVYLCQADNSPAVRIKAKEALMAFGEEGRSALEESRLTSHSFQGLLMQK